VKQLSSRGLGTLAFAEYVFSACISASTGTCKHSILLHVAVAPQFGNLGLICFSGTEAEKPAGQRAAMDGNKIPSLTIFVGSGKPDDNATARSIGRSASHWRQDTKIVKETLIRI
jgi:hypothetical protein